MHFLFMTPLSAPSSFSLLLLLLLQKKESCVRGSFVAFLFLSGFAKMIIVIVAHLIGQGAKSKQL